MLKSTNDFIDILHTNSNQGIIASLDVESLFTNVPIDETIDIIIKHTYNHPTVPPPKISQNILRQLLSLCTREAPFRCPDGKLYVQIQGVAMGSPLGPTFANFYMGDLEQRTLTDNSSKPHIYARYVDDIFVQVKDVKELEKLKQLFEANSVLNFTYELNIDNKLPFLDVLIDATDNQFKTKVYQKPTSQGNCLNGKSECTDKYKTSVISNYLNRAYRISQNWKDFHEEIVHIKQLLINNNFSNTMVDNRIKKFLNNTLSPNVNKKEKKTPIIIYHQGQTHNNYKLDEKVIEEIVDKNTRCIDEKTKIKIIFYYKNKKSANYVMKNNMGPSPTTLQQTNVVYKFTCPLPHSQAVEYIGLTKTTLSRRLTCHGQDGSILKHFKESHNCKPTRDQFTTNTSIVAKENNHYRLAIKEALVILNTKPVINKQFNNFTNVLKLYSLGNPANRLKNTETTLDEPTMPDMETVLISFGIDTTKIKNSPVQDYVAWVHEMLYDFNDSQTPSTISQRIKYMGRQATKRSYKQ